MGPEEAEVPLISNSRTDELRDLALRNSAPGDPVSGAGSGDYILLFSNLPLRPEEW
jgi:galactokinase/mevalonate kinase-like predicted kinase